MWGNKGKRSGWICFPQNIIRLAGSVMIVFGLLLIIAFIPLKCWMVLLGLILLAAGVALRTLF